MTWPYQPPPPRPRRDRRDVRARLGRVLAVPLAAVIGFVLAALVLILVFELLPR